MSITEIMKEFDRIFINENIWKSDNEYTAFTGVGNIKKFIHDALLKIRKETLEEVIEKAQSLKEKRPEDWKDTGVGYNEIAGWNAALSDLIASLKEDK